MAINQQLPVEADTSNPFDTGTTPPASISAEQAVLGGIMLDEQALDDLNTRLSANDFYDSRHKLIFEAIAKLSSERKNIDMVTCAARLEASGQLENAGSMVYLAELTQNIGTIANVPSYARIVRNYSVLRQLIHAGGQIIQNSYQAQGRESHEVIDEAERIVYMIGEREAAVSAPSHIQEGLGNTFTHLRKLMDSNSELPGLSTGFTQLDKMIGGLVPGDLVILAARPGCGKTAFALNIVNNLMRKEKNSGYLFFSLEMATEPVVMRLLANRASVRHDLLRNGKLGGDDSEDFRKLTAASLQMEDSALYIDEAQGLTITEIRSRIRRVSRAIQNKHNIPLKVVFIDYLQLIHSDRSRRQENRATEIGEVSRMLKTMAKEFGVAMVAMSQLNRSIEARSDKKPMLSDLRESGSIEQDADAIMFLHRPKEPKKEGLQTTDNQEEADSDDDANADYTKPHSVDILLLKNRNGKTGRVATNFTPDYQRFEPRAWNSVAS